MTTAKGTAVHAGTGQGVGGADPARSMVSELRERSRAQVAQYHQIRAALEGLRVSSSSSDRSVTVELAAGGAIVDLKLTQQAMSKTPDTLASTILEAIRLGLAQVAERTAAEVEPLTGRRIDVSAVVQGRLPALGALRPDPDADADADAGAGAGAGAAPRETVPSAAGTPSAPPADARFMPEED